MLKVHGLEVEASGEFPNKDNRIWRYMKGQKELLIVASYHMAIMSNLHSLKGAI